MAAAQADRGFVRKYVFSTDHKVIGIQYLLTAMAMALVGGAMAMLIRTQLAWPTLLGDALKPEAYLALVTMHGTLMVFFVVSLALISGLGSFLIPLMIGAREMAYPRLNAVSYGLIVPACLLMIASLFVEGGAAASGWTSYPPLSALESAVPGSGLGQSLWLLAMALFIASFTLTGLNFVATILTLRTSGLSMMRLPLVIWTYLISAVLGLLAFPPLTAATIMLMLDRHAGTSFFLPDGMILGNQVLPNSGGSPLLFQHLFWFLGHPEVYVLALPAVGVAFDVIATFARRPPFGYRVSVGAMGVIAGLSLIVWGHHMYVSGMNPYVGEYFSVVTVLVTLPFSVLGVNLIASLWRGQIRLEIPMQWALCLISAVGIGGLGGLYLGTATSDVYFHDTYFVVGHFHLMIGWVTLFATFAGIYYWFPKMFGRRMGEVLGQAHFWLTVVPTFAMFILMHYQGLGGSLRRVFDPTAYSYTQQVNVLNLPITILAFVAGAAQLCFVLNFGWSACKGKAASENPWESCSLEWSGTSPAPRGNWGDELPVVQRWPYEYGPSAGSNDDVPQAASTDSEQRADR